MLPQAGLARAALSLAGAHPSIRHRALIINGLPRSFEIPDRPPRGGIHHCTNAPSRHFRAYLTAPLTHHRYSSALSEKSKHKSHDLPLFRGRMVRHLHFPRLVKYLLLPSLEPNSVRASFLWKKPEREARIEGIRVFMAGQRIFGVGTGSRLDCLPTCRQALCALTKDFIQDSPAVPIWGSRPHF